MGKGLVGNVDSFEFMNKNNVVARVRIKSDGVSVEVLTNFFLDVPFDLNCDNPLKEIDRFFASRVFPCDRVDCLGLVSELGLSGYKPIDIIRITRGRMFDDNYWVRFPGDTYIWKP